MIKIKKSAMKVKNNGTMQDSGVFFGNETDSTLTKAGYAADAKETGERLSELSEQKVSKTGITLDKDSDGLVYIFIDGAKVGNGVEVNGEIIEGDVIGTLDENNNLLLSGNLADGTYTLKWLKEDGTYSDAGTMEVNTAPQIINLFNAETATYNARISTSDGSIKTGCNGAVTTDLIDVTNVNKLKITGTFANNATVQYGVVRYYTADGSYIPSSGAQYTVDLNGYEWDGVTQKQNNPTLAKVRWCFGIKESTAITSTDVKDIVIEPIE